MLFFLLLVLLFSPSYGAESCTIIFKDSVTVDDTVFTLNDIAVIKDGNQDLNAKIISTVIGQSAPAGYSRFVNTQDLINLNLQARFPGVHFTGVGVTRVVVRTDCIKKKIADFVPSIEAYFDTVLHWGKGNYLISIADQEKSFNLLNAPYESKIGGLKNGQVKGNTSCLLVLKQGSRTQTIPIRCSISVAVPVVISAELISRGEVISASKCRIEKRDITHFGPTPFTSISSVANKIALRTITPGIIIQPHFLKIPFEITCGDHVRIITRVNNIFLSVPGVATQSGMTGERIWVENLVNHKMIKTVIKKNGEVIVNSGGDQT